MWIKYQQQSQQQEWNLQIDGGAASVCAKSNKSNKIIWNVPTKWLIIFHTGSAA